jgi:hypothetical protein
MHAENRTATLKVVKDEASVAEAKAARSVDAQGDLMHALTLDPIAVEQKAHIPKQGFDHAGLYRYGGTDLVQWYARGASGTFSPFGELMLITGDDDADSTC